MVQINADDRGYMPKFCKLKSLELKSPGQKSPMSKSPINEIKETDRKLTPT